MSTVPENEQTPATERVEDGAGEGTTADDRMRRRWSNARRLVASDGEDLQFFSLLIF